MERNNREVIRKRSFPHRLLPEEAFMQRGVTEEGWGDLTILLDLHENFLKFEKIPAIAIVKAGVTAGWRAVVASRKNSMYTKRKSVPFPIHTLRRGQAVWKTKTVSSPNSSRWTSTWRDLLTEVPVNRLKRKDLASTKRNKYREKEGKKERNENKKAQGATRSGAVEIRTLLQEKSYRRRRPGNRAFCLRSRGFHGERPQRENARREGGARGSEGASEGGRKWVSLLLKHNRTREEE